MTSNDLKTVFSRFGEIESAKVQTDKSGRSLKYGFVCFKNKKDAKKCIENANNIVINKKKCYVNLIVPKIEPSSVNDENNNFNDVNDVDSFDDGVFDIDDDDDNDYDVNDVDDGEG